MFKRCVTVHVSNDLSRAYPSLRIQSQYALADYKLKYLCVLPAVTLLWLAIRLCYGMLIVLKE
jgi:hypothetical protein